MNYILKNMDMIESIMYPRYEIGEIGVYKKYQNKHFDIFTKNKSIIFVRDKRDTNNIIIYNDLKTAYTNILNNH